jgi:hypothetical protein
MWTVKDGTTLDVAMMDIALRAKEGNALNRLSGDRESFCLVANMFAMIDCFNKYCFCSIAAVDMSAMVPALPASPVSAMDIAPRASSSLPRIKYDEMCKFIFL